MIVAVRALDLRRVRVSFDAGTDDGALAAVLYTFTATAVPRYLPTVKSARFVNGRGLITDSTVELYLDNDLSPGLAYSMAFVGYGGHAASSSAFVAYSSNWPVDRSFELWDFIPTINKHEDTTQHLERFIVCLQDQLDTTLASIDNWAEILDIDRAPEQWLDLMLADLGNPFQFEDLGENDKRLLLRTLVQLYQLKGTDGAITAAIRLFLGFESQVNLYRESGSLLSKPGTPLDKLDDTFVLGAGTVFDFAVTVATTNAAGRALTVTEASRIRKIVDVIKPVMARLRTIRVGIASTELVQITDTTADVTVSWENTSPAPTNWRIYYGRAGSVRLTPFNSSQYTQVSGATTTATVTTPIGTDPAGTTYFFALVPWDGTNEGFVSDVEVRNRLAAPGSVTATGGVRKVTLSWAAVTGATSYVVYTALTPKTSSTPITADLIDEVLGGLTYFIDSGLLPGEARHYSVVARIGDSEGSYSASTTGTAL